LCEASTGRKRSNGVGKNTEPWKKENPAGVSSGSRKRGTTGKNRVRLYWTISHWKKLYVRGIQRRGGFVKGPRDLRKNLIDSL